MASTTQDANAVARRVSQRVGRTFTAKQVRGWARDNMARFDKSKPENARNLSHDYTTAEATKIVDAMVKRAGGRSAAPKAKAKGSTPRKAKATAPSSSESAS